MDNEEQEKLLHTLAGVLDEVLHQTTPNRVDFYKDENVLISTVEVKDSSFNYETAISHSEYNDGVFIIVDNYHTLEDAKRGHSKWVNTMTHGPLPDKLIEVGGSFISPATLSGPIEYHRKFRH